METQKIFDAKGFVSARLFAQAALGDPTGDPTETPLNRIVVALVTRLSPRSVRARYGDNAGYLIESATVRAIATVGRERKDSPLKLTVAIPSWATAPEQWYRTAWLDKIEERTRMALPFGFPEVVRKHLLDNSDPRYKLDGMLWLRDAFAQMSDKEDDSADRRARQLTKELMTMETPQVVAPAPVMSWAENLKAFEQMAA